jgi:heat shock protein HslJ
MVVTNKACLPDVGKQEDAFLSILRAVRRFEFLEDGTLVLHATDSRTITATRGELRSTAGPPGRASPKGDRAYSDPVEE